MRRVPNGAKLTAVWDGLCPKGALGLSPGFQPSDRPPQRTRPEGAPESSVQKHTCNNSHLERSDFKPLSCLDAQHFLREEVTAASKENGFLFERGEVLRLIHVSSGPFRANRFIGWFPGLKPWAEDL